ncbi:hypothetical protein F5Y12DRAFT_748865 [Xylaria sp. FL1777]|nr:hypothetical protein F5Y12DRAFT_748865 [Xylaria sp. FL1777]
MESSTPLFSPQRCAELHSRLLAKAIEHDPEVYTERTLATRFLQTSPEFAELPSIEEIPLYQFLRLADNTPAAANGRLALLTPLMYQPDPTAFWSERVDEPSFILLYGQNNGDSRLDGGIYLDIQSYRAVWYGGDSLRFPPADQWLPLDVILQKALDAWATGKFYFNTVTASIETKTWTQYDLEQSIAAWNRLLSSIEARMPAEAKETRTSPRNRLEPLSPESLTAFKLSTFAAKFLTTATRPDFLFVAPGTRAFTPSLVATIYGAEASNSSRQTHWLGETEDWPTLVLPGLEPVPHDIRHDANPLVNCFDEAWGFGKFTVNRQSGLYIMPETEASDLIRYVCSSGLCTGGEFRLPCRWGPPREPKLAEVLAHWTTLVEDGTWMVDENGICTEHYWFTANTSEAKVPAEKPGWK